MSEQVHKFQPWFTLKEVPGIGNVIYKRLLDKFQSPEHVFNASCEALAEVKGISSGIIKGIKKIRPGIKSEQEIKAIERAGFRIITMSDEAYPALLRQIPDPPPFFSCMGTIENTFPCIAIVGSRRASSYGLHTAARLARELAAKGFQVVSGMARGIDTAAHKGALEARGRTIAVLGSGLARIYPPENRKLYHKIAETGAVISEFSVNSGPEARHFPIRNRLIAGMSTGTIVVEAASKSGSLITARLSAEYDREVFAVPGSVDSPKTDGTHALLRQGAKLVENCLDVIEELHHAVHEPLFFSNKEEVLQNDSVPSLHATTRSANRYEHSLLKILSVEPMHIDIIIQRSGLDTGGISAALFDLELKGIVKQFPGKLFSI